MPRGRPKGSTGTYFRWPPERIAELWEDADMLVSRQEQRVITKALGVNTKALAKLVKERFPKYQHDTAEQIRQQLEKRYQLKRKLSDVDAFNAAVWKRLLGETK